MTRQPPRLPRQLRCQTANPLPHTDTTTKPQPPASAKDILQLLATVLALMGLLIFAVGYWALTQYFSVFGITPEEAGIDKQTLLVRVGVLTAVLTCLVFLSGFSAALLMGRVLLHAPLAYLWTRPTARGLTVAVLLGSLLYFTSVSRFPSPSVAVLTAASCGLIGFGPLMYVLGRSPSPGVLQALATVLVLAVFTAMWAGQQAQDMAVELRDHGTIAPMTAMLGARPALADASWTDPEGRPRYGAVLYLGEQGGITAIRPCGFAYTERLPSAQIRIALRDTAAASPAWDCHP